MPVDLTTGPIILNAGTWCANQVAPKGEIRHITWTFPYGYYDLQRDWPLPHLHLECAGLTSYDTRLIRLLDRGFYPIELPPTFRTRRFGEIRNAFSPPNNYSGATTFFDGATFRGHLRTFGVVNPANYFLLSKFISTHWNDITKVYRLSSSSGERPKFPAAKSKGRAIVTASIAAKRQSQRHLASSFPIVVHLDVNRFYGSIYTHSIPWAVLGKDEAKRRHLAKTLKGHWSDQLDYLTRNCNQQQTVGIPIGPDTSRIISEIILSRIDNDICEPTAGIKSFQLYHDIDDYQIGVFETGPAENAQTTFVRSISKYELRINDYKTRYSSGFDLPPDHFQRYFDVLDNKTGINFIDHLFELIYTTARRYDGYNVVGHALKRFSKPLATSKQRVRVREYLQRLLFATPFQARWIFPLLLGIYKVVGTNSETKRIISWGIEVSTRRNDVGSLLWFLYAAIFLQIRLGAASCSLCLGMSNPLVDLVMFHGKVLGLFSFGVGDIRARHQGSDFASSAWLPLYEIEKRGWDISTAFTKIGQAQDPGGLYAQLRAKDVEFYVTDQDYFTVEAFDGWGLKQDFFATEYEYDEFAAGPDDVLGYLTSWSDY